MISMISNTRLLAAVAVCGVALAGCDSMKDVRDEPYTAIPTPTVVLQGSISGLGTRRPVVLRNVLQNGTAVTQTEYDFFGTAGATESPFTFGSIPVGSQYDISIVAQPYGKECSITNGSGVAATELPAITVTCVNDADVARYSIGGTISGTVSAIESARIFLTTEEGVRELPAFGQTTFIFPDAVFDSRTSLPIFTWRVTATFTSPDGTVNNCAVTSGTNEAGESTVPPTANVTNVAVTSCAFNITGNVQYSPLPGIAASPMGSGGVTLGLRNIATGEAVPGAPDVNVGAFATTAVSLWPNMLSNARAVYDVVVVQNPAGQSCVVRVTSGGAPTYHGSAVWLVNPVVAAQFQPAGVAVRCRNLPSALNQLAGTYMHIQRDQASSATPKPINNRRYLTFFEEGTFLYANHSATGGATGVEHGFYAYNSATSQITFTVVSDTNGNSQGLSFSGMTGYTSSTAPAPLTLANVPAVKTPAPASTLTLSFMANLIPVGGTVAVPTAVSWEMTEPKSVDGQMTGAWISPDHRRSWIFNFDDTTGIHFGVNGPVNLQDGCFVFDDGTASSGYYTRRGGSTGCMTGGAGFATGFATFDTPGVGASTLPPGWLGKFPGSQGALDGRPPSPNTFSIEAGSPDELTVQGGLNGVPIGSPVTFLRTRAN